MSQPRVEKVADQIIAADAARAQAAGRAGKPDTTQPEEPTPGVVTLGGIPEEPPISPTIDLTDDGRITPTIDLTKDLGDVPPDPPFDSAAADAEYEEWRRQHPECSPDMGFPIKEDDEDEPAAPAETEPVEPPAAALTSAKLAKEPRSEDDPRTSQRARIIIVAVTAAIVLAVIGLSLSGFIGGAGPAGTPGPGASGPAAGTTPTPPPAAGGPPPCEVAGALRTLPGLTATDEAKLCGLMAADGQADQVEYDGTPATIHPKPGDIVAAGIAQVNLSADQAAGLAAKCGTGGLRCAATKPASGTYLMYSVDNAEPAAGVSGAFWETGIGFFDATPEAGVANQPYAGAPADVFTGHNTIYTTRFGSIPTIDVYGPFRLLNLGPTGFMERPSGTFDYLSGNVVIGFIPSAEWDGASTYRFFSYYSLNDNSARAVDEAPDFSKPAIPVPATIPTVELR